MDEPLRGTFFRGKVRIKTNSIRVPVQSREKFPEGTGVDQKHLENTPDAIGHVTIRAS